MTNDIKKLQDEFMNPDGIVLMKRIAASAKVEPITDDFIEVRFENLE